MLRIAGGRPLEVVTLVASPCIVLLVFRAVQKDLTENRRRMVEASVRAEASARQIEDDHRIALMAEELAGLGQWRLDAKSGRFSCSEGVRQIYGIASAAEDPTIEAILAMHDTDDRAAVSARVAQAMRDGTPFSFESRITTADGEVRHILVNAAAELDAAGEVETVFGATMDVTQARSREDALRQSESRFRMLADHSTDVIVWFRPDGTILYASPSARTLGYAPEEVVGRKTFEFVHPDDRERAISVIRALFSGESPDASVRREYRFLVPARADTSGSKAIRLSSATRQGGN